MACPVCFTDADPAITQSLNAGIFVLLGATALVLGGLVRFIARIARLSSSAEAAHYEVDRVRPELDRRTRLQASPPANG